MTVSTRAHQWSLSRARFIQSRPSHPISLISSSQLRLGLPSGLFPSGFPIKILYAFFFSPMRATCAVDPILVDLITLIRFDETYILWSSSLWGLLQPPAISSLVSPHILPSTLFSNTLNLCSFLSVRDQVPRPHKTKCRIMVLYKLISKV